MNNPHAPQLELFPGIHEDRITPLHLVIEAAALSIETAELFKIAQEALENGHDTQALMAASRADSMANRCDLLHLRMADADAGDITAKERRRWANDIIRAQTENQKYLAAFIDQHWIRLQQQAARRADHNARHWMYAAVAIEARAATVAMLRERGSQHRGGAAMRNLAATAMEAAVQDAVSHSLNMTSLRDLARSIDQTQRQDLSDRAEAALETMCNTWEQQQKAFSASLPVQFTPVTADLPSDVTDELVEAVISPTRAAHVVLDPDRFADHAWERHSLIVACYHDGQRLVRAATEPFPRDYDDALARQQIRQMFHELSNGPVDSAERDHAIQDAIIAGEMVDLGIHKVSATDLAQVVAPLVVNERGAAQASRVIYAVCRDPEIVAIHSRTGELPDWQVSQTQADAIIEAAEDAGLAPERLHDLAMFLGHDPIDLEIDARPMNGPEADQVLERAHRAGLPAAAMKRMLTCFVD